MKIALNCSEQSRTLLMELLSARGIAIDSEALVGIVETGMETPFDKISIVFGMSNLARLVDLLDKLVDRTDKTLESVIGRNIHESYEIIPLDQILYFEGRGNNVFCLTAAGEYRVKEKLYELELKLPRNSFIRVAKAYIVNIDNVKEIIPWFGRRLVLKFVQSKKEVEVSKNYVRSVKEFLGI